MNDWRTLPKVELHCHLLGVIDPNLLSESRSHGHDVLVEPDILRAIYPVSSLAKFKRWLELVKPYQTECAHLMRPFLTAHVASLIAQRVAYAEIMLSPTIFPREPRALVRSFREWRDWTFELEQGRVQIEYLMVIPRSLDPSKLEHDVRSYIDLYRANLIVGVALVGLETGESIERFSKAFAEWRDAGLGIEIHAGEHSGPESVHDAIRFGRPNRMGHCLSAFRDLALIESIKDSKIHIEFCPTSNLNTGAFVDPTWRPIRHALQQGLSFSINTDNPGAFGCSLESEYQLLADSIGFTAANFQTIFRHSLAARFQPKLRYINFSADQKPLEQTRLVESLIRSSQSQKPLK
jgi:aminodeoxyfutalosine deaminase